MASDIIFTHDTADVVKKYQQRYSKSLVIVDENTEKYCLPKIAHLFSPESIIRIQSGEENKHLGTCELIWSFMTDAELDRKAVIFNLGGGVIGDMGGFSAATYKRGIDFIQIPTTLLSQVDASVGGKLGVDFKGFKNHIGVFKEPIAVIIDDQFLQTLPFAELRSGFAEIIKHCLIADAGKWNEIKNTTDISKFNWLELAQHSVAIKDKITKEDPTEKGLRKILNFGHTIGHAIETYFLNQPGKRLLHGEAIAIGMIAEAYLAEVKGFISRSDVQEIEQYILAIYGKVTIDPATIEEMIDLTHQDKKNEHGAVLYSLLNKIGEANFNISANRVETRAAIEYYVQLNN
ncbi:MAG: 3-dehydroquinate synthase [Cytophagaceae bacterium]